MSSTFTPVKTPEPVVDDTDEQDFDGWYCIETNPFPCPCGKFTANHVTAMHLILVWPEKDDPQLLDVAKEVREVGRNPRVIEYEKSFGPAISFYQFEAMGRAAHINPRNED